MHPIMNIAIAAARKAGDIINRSLERIESLQVAEKQQNDFVTEVDLAAENAIIEIIRKSFPSHSILAEESGEIDGDGVQWIIDPLDGTRNFLHGFPHVCVSIAIKVKNTIEHGVIYDPFRHELFTASRGAGARLNDRRLRVAKRITLADSLIATGFPCREKDLVRTYLKSFEAMMMASSGIRRAGAAALDMAYVASGRFDGFWEYHLQPWDMAAGTILVREAGGLVGDFSGGENFMESGNIVCGNPKIFKAMLQTLQPHVQ